MSRRQRVEELERVISPFDLRKDTFPSKNTAQDFLLVLQRVHRFADNGRIDCFLCPTMPMPTPSLATMSEYGEDPSVLNSILRFTPPFVQPKKMWVAAEGR